MPHQAEAAVVKHNVSETIKRYCRHLVIIAIWRFRCTSHRLVDFEAIKVVKKFLIFGSPFIMALSANRAGRLVVRASWYDEVKLISSAIVSCSAIDDYYFHHLCCDDDDGIITKYLVWPTKPAWWNIDADTGDKYHLLYYWNSFIDWYLKWRGRQPMMINFMIRRLIEHLALNGDSI